jgi:GDPmannose 4,6-dehydratase
LQGALEIANGKRESLEFGNLEIKRDFGWSEKYVEAMWLILQYEKAEDFVVCSGKSIRLRDIVEYVFGKLQIAKDKIIINPALFRPTEIVDIYGDNRKIKNLLHWQYDMDFFSVLDKLIEEEKKNYAGK